MRLASIIIAILVFAAPAFAQSPPPPPDLTIKLPVASWSVILQALGELPLKISQPIWVTIQEQAKIQLEAAQKPKDEKPNK